MGNKCCACNVTKPELTFINEHQESNEKIKTLKSVKKNQLASRISRFNFISDSEEEEYLAKLLYIQSIIKGFTFRCIFKKMRKRLWEDVEILVSNKIKTFKSFQVQKAENNNNPFNFFRVKNQFENEDLEDEHLSNSIIQDLHTKYNSPIFYKPKLKTNCLITNNYLYLGGVNLDGHPHGEGEYYFTNGTVYKGLSVRGKINGYGRFIDNDGTLYEGFFVNQNLQGLGSKVCLNGTSYEGGFRNGLKHGTGKEICYEYVYIGEFVEDKKEGNGQIEYKISKDKYKGSFKNDFISGYGEYTWSNKNYYKGDFKNGKMHGRGKYKWPDGSEFEGEYKDNIKEGHGRFKWKGNKEFIGPFENGKPHGKGKLTIDGKSEVNAIFIDGKLKVDKVEK